MAQAEKIYIKRIGLSDKQQYLLQCPELNKEVEEKRCTSCQYLRIMEADFVKCNYRNIIDARERGYNV